jgi:hypothetical protein
MAITRYALLSFEMACSVVFTVQMLNKGLLSALYRDRFAAAEFNESLIFWS